MYKRVTGQNLGFVGICTICLSLALKLLVYVKYNKNISVNKSNISYISMKKTFYTWLSSFSVRLFVLLVLLRLIFCIVDLQSFLKKFFDFCTIISLSIQKSTKTPFFIFWSRVLRSTVQLRASICFLLFFSTIYVCIIDIQNCSEFILLKHLSTRLIE